jgi:hypothetical protein
MKFIILEFTPSTALFHPPTQIPGTVSADIIFAFAYMCIHYLHCIHPPIPFTATSPFPLVPNNPPDRTCSTQLFPNSVEEKTIRDNKRNMAFLLV